jgi:hypothetical protein
LREGVFIDNRGVILFTVGMTPQLERKGEKERERERKLHRDSLFFR